MRFGPKKTNDTTPQNSKKATGLSARWRKAALAGAAFATLIPGVTPPPGTPSPTPADTTAVLSLPTTVNARVSSTSCVPAADMLGNNAHPQLKPVFERMVRLPVSGAAIVNRIMVPSEDVDACTSRDLPDGTLIATYESPTRRLIVPHRDAPPATIAHEIFHAHQHLTGGFTGVASNRLLTAGDRATGMLLIEATAAAYGMVAMKEASFYDASYAKHMRTHNYGMTRTFNTAFDASYAANANQPEQDRRRLALQAGGQAVVRALMNGQSSEWKGLYKDEAARYLRLASFNGVRTAEYTATRDGLYARIGQVSPSLQLVPVEFFGSLGNTTIAASQKEFSLRVPAAAQPQQPASSPRRPAA